MVPFSVKCDYVQRICVVSGGKIMCKMPSDAVSLVTTGIGVSVLAGILSGVCYVIANGFGPGKRNRKKKLDWYCEICKSYQHSTVNILNDDLVTCSKCGAKVCTLKCAEFMQHTQWICKNCLRPSNPWFKNFFSAIQSNKSQGNTMLDAKVNPINSDSDSLQRLEREQIRDFIEKLVNVMVGENVDNASVSMLCNDHHYLPVVGQSPCTAHAALKQLIEKLLKEAVNVPLIEQARVHPVNVLDESTNKTYEDLLATAIINKVVTSCQNKHLPSSSANSFSSRLSTSSRNNNDREYFFGEETLDSKWKTDADTTSVSSLEEWLQTDSSRSGSRKYVDKVTLMIKQDIEEVDNSEYEEDDAEYFRSSSSLLNDSESNWFLQKRKFHGTHSPVPVPMLVPNPSKETKVLIGDKPLDDTSDLSDVGSDYEEAIRPSTTHTLLVQSKNIIGGGKPLNCDVVETADVQSESSTDSGVKEVNGQEQKTFDVQEALKTDLSLDDDNVEDFISASSNTEKEAEYTEKYASLPKQITKRSVEDERLNGFAEDGINEEKYVLNNDDSDLKFVGGTYSRKEKEKWNHAIEMKNNPYSKESIEKRIKSSYIGDGVSYGPDYYARLAGKPSGGGKLTTEVNGISWPPSEPFLSRSPSPPPDLPKTPPPSRELIEIASLSPPEIPTVLPSPRSFLLTTSKESEIPPEPPKTLPPPKDTVEVDGIHRAIKAILTSEKDGAMPSYTDLSQPDTTSDSDLSYVNSYDVEHSQVVRKSKNENVQIPIKTTPQGLSYRSLPNNNDYEETPVARPRILGNPSNIINDVNNPVVAKPRVLPMHNPPLTSPIEESYNSPPKVLHQKRDNTLISKIYKDPRVRLFSLHSREEHPGSERDFYTPPFSSLKPVINENKFTYKEKSVHLNHTKSGSDDGLTSEGESGKTGKMSFFSSEEDLLSLNSESSIHHIEITSASNGEVKVGTDLRAVSPHISSSSSKRYINRFSSHEDLLSPDDHSQVSSIPRRKDNTLISKIYQDPNVRNFAIKTHKNFIDDYEGKTWKSSNSDEEFIVKGQQTIVEERNKYNAEVSPQEISLDVVRSSSSTPSPDETESWEIDDLAKKHVVSGVLNKVHKTETIEGQPDFVHAAAFARSTSVDDLSSIRVSVRDLRMKFESSNESNKPVISSLTARSLSKQVKDILKQ